MIAQSRGDAEKTQRKKRDGVLGKDQEARAKEPTRRSATTKSKNDKKGIIGKVMA